MSNFANGAMHLRIKIHCHSLYAAGSSVCKFLMMASNENKKLEHASAKNLFSLCSLAFPTELNSDTFPIIMY